MHFGKTTNGIFPTLSAVVGQQLWSIPLSSAIIAFSRKGHVFYEAIQER